jgi:hypothetical protein
MKVGKRVSFDVKSLKFVKWLQDVRQEPVHLGPEMSLKVKSGKLYPMLAMAGIELQQVVSALIEASEQLNRV